MCGRGQQLTVNPFAQKREKCSKQPFQCQASEVEECMYIEINSTYFTTVQIDTLYIVYTMYICRGKSNVIMVAEMSNAIQKWVITLWSFIQP